MTIPTPGRIIEFGIGRLQTSAKGFWSPGWLSLYLNLPLVLSGLTLYSFDAYFHIFMADHYRRLWFDLYEAKWFGGFSVASYPPLVHQLIALLSRPASVVAGLAGGSPNEIRFRGEVVGYGVMLLVVLACLPQAVEHFARIFVPARAARAAAWLSVGLPSIYLTAYSFGQLPTLAATAGLLWALGEGWQYARAGRARDLISAVLWAGVTAAAHHAVLLFAFVAGIALAGRAFIQLPEGALRSQRTIDQTPARSSFSAAKLFFRLLAWATLAGAFAALVIWPFIAWSRGYVPQTPIDHASRHNLLAEPSAAYFFFWPMYGPLLLVLPAMGWLCIMRPARLKVEAVFRKRRHWALMGAAVILFVLGLGGTTPLPRLLFGSEWAWLTYDRFSLWAGLSLLPFAGLLYHLYHRRWKRLLTCGLTLSAAFCLFAAFAARLAGAQPAALDLETVARFLNEHTRNGDRYLTLGFGDQLARLSVLTEARTIDGVYFTARTAPELRGSGLGALDGVMWNPAGAGSIKPFLELGQAWGVRWVLNAHAVYEEPLRASGYELRGIVAPGVQVWRNSAAWVSTEWQAEVDTDSRAAIWWGIAPLTALALSVAALAYRARLNVSFPRLSLVIFFSLWPFWYHVTLWTRPWVGVYFVYTSAILTLADVLAVGIVLAVIFRGKENARRVGPGALRIWFGLIVFCAVISIPASTDPILSLGFALHLALLGAAAWSVARLTPEAGWPSLARALTTGLVIQSIIALIEVAGQDTAWLASLGMPWPGELWAATKGASVAALPNGARWLRAYGSLPHPNILGGFLVTTLAGPIIGYVTTGKLRWLLPLTLGAAALFLTFSRAAWLGAVTLLIAVMVLLPPAGRQRGAIAAASVAIVALALAAALWPLVSVRVTASSESDREVASTLERMELAQMAFDYFRQRPFNGAGAGTFAPTMVASGEIGGEPVHNVTLLALSETGLGGGAAVIGLGLSIGWLAWRRRGSGEPFAILSAGLIGLIVIAQFDHFMWSLSTGRLWAAVMIGVWLGAQKTSPPDGH